MARNLFLAGILLASSLAANVANAQSFAALNDLPDDPASQQTSPAPAPQDKTAAPAVSQPPQTAAPSPSQTAAPSSEQQLKQEEKQRILGVMPTFNVTDNHNALPLSPGQKFQLFFKSTLDPWTFGLAGYEAGIGQAENTPAEYGQGFEGYAKRFGANYADTFDGNLWGNAILTSWWHEDPRYYRKGTGNVMGRFGWAAASTVWCKRDKGTWGPNYANVIGNFIGAGIANLYYPQAQRTVSDTFRRGAETTAYGIIAAEVIEFWPDIAHHYTEKHRQKKAQEASQRDAAQVNAQAVP